MYRRKPLTVAEVRAERERERPALLHKYNNYIQQIGNEPSVKFDVPDFYG
jgi:hypothetical protein